MEEFRKVKRNANTKSKQSTNNSLKYNPNNNSKSNQHKYHTQSNGNSKFRNYPPKKSSTPCVNTAFPSCSSTVNTHKTKHVPKEQVLIDSSSLIALCSPFVIPQDTDEKTYVLDENRYPHPEKTDLSIIYGSLDEKPRSLNCEEYTLKNKHKLLSNLKDTLDLINTENVFNDPDFNYTNNNNYTYNNNINNTSPYNYGINDIENASDLINSDWDYDSNIDSDIELINDAILSSNINNSMLIPGSLDKPLSNEIKDIEINNMQFF